MPAGGLLICHQLFSWFEAIDLRFEALDHRFDALEHTVTSPLRGEIVASTRTFVTWMIAVGGWWSPRSARPPAC